MIIHDVEQGTPEWLALRAGLPTASEFELIITPCGKMSKSAEAYATRLAAEIVLGRSLEKNLDCIEAVQRGREMEPFAALAYEFETGYVTEKVGFITDDACTFGVSPDRLIGNDGMAEFKCPLPQTHALYMIRGFETKYFAQVQAQLLGTEREWNDRVSYSDELPIYRERTYRDDKFLKNLTALLTTFHEMKPEMVEKIQTAVAGGIASGEVVR